MSHYRSLTWAKNGGERVSLVIKLHIFQLLLLFVSWGKSKITWHYLDTHTCCDDQSDPCENGYSGFEVSPQPKCLLIQLVHHWKYKGNLHIFFVTKGTYTYISEIISLKENRILESESFSYETSPVSNQNHVHKF